MFFISKLFNLLTWPDNILYLVLVFLCFLGFSRWRRRLPAALAVLVVLLTLIGAAPWYRWALEPMEDRFAVPSPLPEHVDGVIVLGGSVEQVVTAGRGQLALNDGVERLLAMVELSRRYPQARLVFTGGSGNPAFPDLKEAPVSRDAMAAMGMDVSRLILEDASRNTWENAVFSRDLVKPAAGEVWILVTSALHMPRSVGVFRAAGWPAMVAYPVDYRSSGQPGQEEFGFNLRDAFHILGLCMHEWVGLAYYRLRGWSDAWFPAP